MKREEGRGKRKSVEPPRNAASYQSQNFAEKRLYGVGNRAASGTTAPTQVRRYRALSLLARGARSAMTDSAEFLESDE